MGWSVPVLEKGSWAMAQVFISVGTWRYNYNLQPLQSLRPTLPSLLDWLSDVGACITLDIHILRSCSETSLLIHCKVPLIADICKLILQTYQTSDNHSLHASHFSSWSLFFSTQCCYCAKTFVCSGISGSLDSFEPAAQWTNVLAPGKLRVKSEAGRSVTMSMWFNESWTYSLWETKQLTFKNCNTEHI